MIILLIAAGGSMVNTVSVRFRIKYINLISLFMMTIFAIDLLQTPLSGDFSSIKFNFVVISAVSSMFTTSQMGNTISYKVFKKTTELKSKALINKEY